MAAVVWSGVALNTPPLAVSYAQSSPQTPTFERAVCPFDVPDRLREGQDVVCGYVTVPANHTNPTADETARLAVAIFKATRTATADPIFYLDGGPGTWTLVDAADILEGIALLHQTHDVILFDQRGVGFSEPNLDCPASTTQAYALLAEPLSARAIDTALAQTIIQCGQDLAAQGINLAHFTTRESAADVKAIRQALGYETINLYGVSYGTRVALTVMRDFPDHLRAVVLDSGLPLEADFYHDQPYNGYRAFAAMVAACAADADCNAAYPTIEQDFLTLVETTNTNPIRVRARVGDSFYDVHLTGDDLVLLMYDALYSVNEIMVLPKAIEAARNGDYRYFAEGMIWRARSTQTFSEVLFYVMDCQEEIPFSALPRLTFSDIPAPFRIISDASILDLCAAWNLPAAPPLENLPVVSPIPTLILSGAFDPVTAPAYGEQLHNQLIGSFYVLAPYESHGVGWGRCSQGIIKTFVDTLGAPDTTCLSDGSLDFVGE